jgi:hypothetical protein
MAPPPHAIFIRGVISLGCKNLHDPSIIFSLSQGFRI